MWTMRLGSKNMCSVRLSPMPSAPKSRAVSASTAVSALARTPMVRMPSTQSMSWAKSPVSFGLMVGTRSSITSPLAPSMVITSPSFTTTSPAVRVLAA